MVCTTVMITQDRSLAKLSWIPFTSKLPHPLNHSTLLAGFPGYSFLSGCYAFWERNQLSTLYTVHDLGKKRSFSPSLQHLVRGAQGNGINVSQLFSSFLKHREGLKIQTTEKDGNLLRYFKSLHLNTSNQEITRSFNNCLKEKAQ